MTNTTVEERIYNLSAQDRPFEMQINFHKGQDGENNLFSCNISCWHKMAWQFRGYGETIEGAINEALTKAEKGVDGKPY